MKSGFLEKKCKVVLSPEKLLEPGEQRFRAQLWSWVHLRGIAAAEEPAKKSRDENIDTQV